MKKIVFLCFASTLLLSSCNFYKPTVMNAPVLEKKGELNLGASVGSSVDVTASYAATDKLAIIAAAGNSYNITLSQDSASYEFKNHKYELGLGYFNHIDSTFYYNVFGGFGLGKAGTLTDDVFNGFIFTEGGYGARFNQLFLQSSMHAKLNEETFIGIVARLNHLNFYDFEYSFDPKASGRFVAEDKQVMLGQVALDIRIKGNIFGGFTQVQYAFSGTNQDYFSLRDLGFHGGIFIRLHQLFE